MEPQTKTTMSFSRGLPWLIVLALIIIGGFAATRQGKSETIKVGAIFALSGNAAQYGEWARGAVLLAADEINSKGGIGGRRLEVIFEDDKGETASAVAAYQKLTKVNEVKAVLTFLSSVALAVEPLANQDKILQMDVSATTPDYSTLNDYSFRTGIVATQLAKESAAILTNQLKARQVAVLYINNDFGKGMLGAFKSSFSGDIVREESFNQNDTDFRIQLLKLRTIKDLDYILLVGHLKESGLLVRQAEELGIKTHFFSDVYSIEGPDFIQAAEPSSAEGIIYVAPKFDVKDTNPAVASFVSAYRSRYTEDPTVFAAQSYDGLVALAKAFDACKTIDSECSRTQLARVSFPGASGMIKFDSSGDVVKGIELKQVKSGQFVPYEK